LYCWDVSDVQKAPKKPSKPQAQQKKPNVAHTVSQRFKLSSAQSSIVVVCDVTTYTLSLAVEHRPQTNCLHPAQSCAAVISSTVSQTCTVFPEVFFRYSFFVIFSVVVQCARAQSLFAAVEDIVHKRVHGRFFYSLLAVFSILSHKHMPMKLAGCLSSTL